MIFLTPSYTHNHWHSSNHSFLTTPPLIFILTSSGSHLTFDKSTGAIKFYSSDGGSLERYLYDTSTSTDEGPGMEGTLRHVLQPFRNVREIRCFWECDAILLALFDGSFLPCGAADSPSRDDDDGGDNVNARGNDDTDCTVSLFILPLRHPEHHRSPQNLAVRSAALYSLIHPQTYTNGTKAEADHSTEFPATSTTRTSISTPLSTSSNPAYSCLYSPDTSAFLFMFISPSASSSSHNNANNDNTTHQKSSRNDFISTTHPRSHVHTTHIHPHSHIHSDDDHDESDSNPLIYLSHASSGGYFLMCPVYDMIDQTNVTHEDSTIPISSSWQLVLPIPGIPPPLITPSLSTTSSTSSQPDHPLPPAVHINLNLEENIGTGPLADVHIHTDTPVNTHDLDNILPTPPDSPTIAGDDEEPFQPLLGFSASLSRSEPMLSAASSAHLYADPDPDPEIHSSPRASGDGDGIARTNIADSSSTHSSHTIVSRSRTRRRGEGSSTGSVTRPSPSDSLPVHPRLRDRVANTRLACFYYALLSIFRWALCAFSYYLL